MHSSFIATILAFAAWGAHAVPVAPNSGWATYYTQQGVAGSCGVRHADTDLIVAVSHELPHNTYCGRTVTIKNSAGTSITATVADTCYACAPNDLDLSVGAFEALAGGGQSGLNIGKFDIQWQFN